jgi:predicted nucleic acid-binding protein
VIVADTNLILYLFIKSDFTREAEGVYRKDSNWVAPTLWRSEFRNALASCMRRGLLTLPEAIAKTEAAELLMNGREFRVSSHEVLRLAAASGCSAYDCEYVTLAQDLGVRLVTTDGELLSKFASTAVSMRHFCARKPGSRDESCPSE